MRLQEAINYLSAMEEDYADEDGIKQTKALKLGKAALGQFVILRKAQPIFKNVLLPGETKD